MPTLSLLSSALSSPGGDAGSGRRAPERFWLRWRNGKKSFKISVYLIRGSKWDSLGNSNGVALCSYGCICVPPYYHLHERDKCDNLCYSAVCCRKYKIALEGWRKAPAVVNTCEDNTDHFIVSACAIRRKLFFFFASLLEASPFHPRAITSTHILNQTGWWAGEKEEGNGASSFWTPSERQRSFQKGRSVFWDCGDDFGVCQDSKRPAHMKWKSKKYGALESGSRNGC